MIVRLSCQRCHFCISAKTQQAAVEGLQEHWIYCYQAQTKEGDRDGTD